jgi:hypothetical protein
MADMEQAIGITAKLYRARKAAKFLLGDDYPAEMATWRDGIEKIAAARKVSNLQATVLLSKKAGENGDGVVQLMILAAYVEMTEPSAEVAA